MRNRAHNWRFNSAIWHFIVQICQAMNRNGSVGWSSIEVIPLLIHMICCSFNAPLLYQLLYMNIYHFVYRGLTCRHCLWETLLCLRLLLLLFKESKLITRKYYFTLRIRIYSLQIIPLILIKHELGGPHFRTIATHQASFWASSISRLHNLIEWAQRQISFSFWCFELNLGAYQYILLGLSLYSRWVCWVDYWDWRIRFNMLA